LLQGRKFSFDVLVVAFVNSVLHSQARFRGSARGSTQYRSRGHESGMHADAECIFRFLASNYPRNDSITTGTRRKVDRDISHGMWDIGNRNISLGVSSQVMGFIYEVMVGSQPADHLFNLSMERMCTIVQAKQAKQYLRLPPSSKLRYISSY